MRPGLWHELSNCWPCRYNSFGCSTLDTSNIDAVPQIDAAAMTQVRDAMRAGMYIDVEGVRYPVIVDTGIFEHNSTNNANLDPGEYASSIYAIPLTIQGGFPVTYMEYTDFRQAQADVNLLRGSQSFFWTDQGFYSWATEYVKWCYKLALKVEPRIVLRAPMLAGRVDAIRYAPLQHGRDTDPSSSYFADGGVSLRGGLSTPYSVWTSRQ
jgi:hypothetical protein